MYRKTQSQWTKHLDFILLDLLCLFLSLAVTYKLRGIGTWILETSSYSHLILCLLVIDLVAAGVFKQYKSVLKRGMFIEMGYTLRNTAIVAACTTTVLFGFRAGAYFSRLVFFWGIVLYTALTYLVRIGYKQFYRKKIIPQRGRSLLVITDCTHITDINGHIEKHFLDGFRLAGLAVTDAPDSVKDNLTAEQATELEALLKQSRLPIVANRDGVEEYVRLNWVDEILIYMTPDEDTIHLADIFLSMGITVHIGLDTVMDGLPGGNKQVEKLGGYNVITVAWNSISYLDAALKRILDILGGIVGLVFTLILTLFIGPAIYFTSPGPIFFKQERVGQNGKIFKMYKFRSMVMNADELKAKYMAQNRVGDGMMFKLDWDPRIIGNKELPDGTRKTGIGEFIRRTSLDEFPQFINVLKGNMSLVGTRPPTLDEWKKYKDHHRARMAMRPGITGMWQVSGRSNITDFEEIVRLDTQYISQWSLALDIKILFKTIAVVLKHEGSM